MTKQKSNIKTTLMSNSFSRKETELLCTILEKAQINREMLVLVRNPVFASLHGKFLRMKTKWLMEDHVPEDTSPVSAGEDTKAIAG